MSASLLCTVALLVLASSARGGMNPLGTAVAQPAVPADLAPFVDAARAGRFDAPGRAKRAYNTALQASGVIFQPTPSPGVHYNATIVLNGGGGGFVSFYNAFLGLRCIGGVVHTGQPQQDTYAFGLQVDHSSQTNLCLSWGTLQIGVPSHGLSSFSIHPHGNQGFTNVIAVNV